MNEYSLFNQPSSIEVQDIHHSWILDMPNGELIEKLRKTISAQKPLTEFIKQYIFLEEQPVLDDVTKVIQQASPSTLNDLVSKIGVTLLSNTIRQTIMKKEVIRIKESLGEDLYDFSVKKSPSINASSEHYDMAKYHFDDSTSPLNTVKGLGYKSLRLALGNIDSACIYKLPKEWDSDYTNNKVVASDEDINIYKKIILNLIQAA